MVDFHQQMMARCVQLARLGLGKTYPNPMVGSVIVHNGKIIGEGWHQKAGQAHAEVNAISSVADKSLLTSSTIYVSLEPCSHFGKTPPCADLIIASKIPHVVIATLDPFAKVNGAGVQKLKDAGIQVEIGVLEKEAQQLNQRFFTFHLHKRPYVILKWAQTQNHKIASDLPQQKWISNAFAKQLVHKWRTEEQAILVGTNTAKIDNPQLNSRLWAGNQPIRIVLDKNLTLDKSLNLFDQTQNTLIFNQKENSINTKNEFVKVAFDENLIPQILEELYKRNIQSLIVEGGPYVLKQFIEANLWDEARIFTSDETWDSGLDAPEIQGKLISTQNIQNNQLSILTRE